MQHSLKISICKDTQGPGIVRCKKASLKDRLLRRFFNENSQVMVIVPGNSVKMLAIHEIPEGSNE